MGGGGMGVRMMCVVLIEKKVVGEGGVWDEGGEGERMECGG